MDISVFDIFNLKTNNINPQKGSILISEPFLNDSIFRRSVILMTEHSPSGSMGLVLNKTSNNHNIKKLLNKEFLTSKIQLFKGGPVAPDEIFFLYASNECLVNKSVEIIPGLFWGGEYEHFRELVISDIIPLNKIRFFNGYSGWAANQLENELKENFWLVKNISPEEVINLDMNIWKNQVDQLGEKYKRWSLIPENPLLN